MQSLDISSPRKSLQNLEKQRKTRNNKGERGRNRKKNGKKPEETGRYRHPITKGNSTSMVGPTRSFKLFYCLLPENAFFFKDSWA